MTDLKHFKKVSQKIDIIGLEPKSKGKIVFFFLFLFLISPSLIAKTNFPLVNSAYKYNVNAPVKCKYLLAAKEDSVHVYLKIDLTDGSFDDGYKIGYELKNFYCEKSQEIVASLYLNNLLLGKKRNTYFLKIPLKVDNNINLMLLSIIKDDETAFYFDIPLNLTDNFSPPNLILTNFRTGLPVFNNYLKMEEEFVIRQSFGSSEAIPVYFYQYKYNFTAAFPPMASGAEPAKALEIDSVFSISSSGPANLNNQALYFAQRDTSSFKGISFRVVPPYYPDLKRAEEIIDPLIYISTNSEMARLSKAEDLKKALDTYWLDLINNPGRAKITIKSYYDQVELANRLFTTYKEGWKTDQGMIYTLYGAPDEVYFDGNEEQWIYKKTNDFTRVKFTFVKIKNIFTNQHFELMRNKSYESFWFGNVELWRKGIKNL